jgi:CheY-like chemotaxis protein
MPQLKTILCADDEPLNLEILEAYLEGHYQVDTVEDGIQCLAYLKEKRPDLILLDHLMPELNGLDVCTIIKMNDQTREIPVIISSGNASDEDKRKAKLAKADDYLAKPFDADELFDVINRNIS